MGSDLLCEDGSLLHRLRLLPNRRCYEPPIAPFGRNLGNTGTSSPAGRGSATSIDRTVSQEYTMNSGNSKPTTCVLSVRQGSRKTDRLVNGRMNRALVHPDFRSLLLGANGGRQGEQVVEQQRRNRIAADIGQQVEGRHHQIALADGESHQSDGQWSDDDLHHKQR